MEPNIFDVADDMSFPWLPAYAEAIEQQQQHQNLHQHSVSPLLSTVGSGTATTSRMLETIVEETSSDDDVGDGSRSGSRSRQSRPRTSEGDCCPNGWAQYHQVWSSAGSDTGSVIRVDTPSDQDAMSERDFICPPKRRRQDQQDLVDEACSNSGTSSNSSSNEELFNGSTGELTVIVTAPPNAALTTNGGYYGGIGGLRKARYCELDQQQLQQQQGLEVNEYFMRRHNEPRLRFDEIGHDLFAATCGGPDSDSLSYASLSRSSSLIQFESLERQLQNELQSVGSGSVPSLYSADPPVNGGNVGVAEGFYSPSKKSPLSAASKLKVVGGVNGVTGKQSQPVLNNSDSELYSSSASSGGDSSGGSSCNYASDECDLNQHTPSPSSEESGQLVKGSSSDEADGPVQQLLLVRSCPQRCSERRLNRQNAAKNSIESLSEDSGYCDHLHFNMNNLRVRSKSLTNFGGSADNVNMLTEPVDFYDRPSFQENRLSTVCDVDEEEEEQVNGESNKYEEQRWYGAKTNIHNCTKIDLDASKQQHQQPFVVQTKVMPTSSSSSSSASTSPTSSQNASTDSLERPISTSDLDRHQPKPKNSNHRDEFSAASRKRPRSVISASSPDLFGVHAGSQVLRSRKQQSSKSRKTSSDHLLEFSVSSVPECLNLYGGGGGVDFDRHQSESLDSLSESGTSSGNYCSWNVPQECSVASKNFDLYDLQESKTVVKKVTFQAVSKPRVNIRASYANLTVLDYSDEEEGGGRQYYLNRNTFRTSSGTRLGGVREMASNGRVDEEDGRLFPVEGDEKNVFNSLLDEISAHFDRNLSIINDQAEAYEPIAAFLHEQRSGQTTATPFSALVAAPQPPPRRTQIKTNPHHSQQQVTTIVVQPPDVKKRTFDQDPTNLVTCYAASLERCTFDPSESSLNLYGSKSSELNLPRGYAPVKREFVASTPNLNYYYSGSGYGDCEEGLHNSLKNVSCLEIGSRSTGILATASSSKCGLSKGVSFCPIVSEIIWKDNCSELDPDDDNASVISNQDFEIDVDDEDFEPDDAEHASLTQTNTLLNANSIETGLCELMNDPSSTSHHHQRTDDSQQLRAPTPPERSPRENGEVTCTSLSQERTDDHERDGNSSSNVNNNATTAGSQLESSQLSNEVITAEERTTTTMASAIANGDASRNLIAAETAAATAATSDDQQQVQGAEAVATSPKFVNNNNNLIKNFKNGKAEKKGKTFLSRLSSGFRFSFRGKGKKNKDGGVVGKTGNTGSAGGGAIAGRSDKQQGNDTVSADFIYIPLKDPKQGQSNGTNNSEIEPAGATDDDEERYLRQMNTVGLESCEATAEDEPDRAYDDANESDLTFRSDSILNSTTTSLTGNTAAGHKNHVLSGKPPLPKQPPRVVGVCAKRSGPAVARAHAQQYRASSTPPRTEIDLDDDVDDGQGFSFRQYAAEGDTSRTSSVASSAGRRYRANSSTHSPAAGDTNYFNHIMGSEQKIGLIETNLDTHETVISGKTRSLMELGGPNQLQVHQIVISGNNSGGGGPAGKVNGIKEHHRQTAANGGGGVNEPGRPHKSMEFLLDKENQRNVLPPENELQKSHETGTNLSEHQLRVQASLQRLNIPDWYKQYSTGKDGHPSNPNAPQAAPGTCAGTGILRKRNSDVGRWTGLSSKTTSLSSLGSHRSDRSPVMLSPSAHSHTGGQTGFSRWSTSHLNSNQTSPSVSTRGSFTRGGLNASVISGYSTASTTVGATAANPSAAGGTIRNSFRQPYLGWRSQEKLSQPRTPAERLASSLLSQQKSKEQQQQHHHHHHQNQHQKSDPVVTPEIQSSIKEVTSAIVHYVNDQTNRHSRSRSTSPSQRCWLESSFVGTRPLDSPQTPMIEGGAVQSQQQQHQSQLAGDHYRYNAGRMNGVGESTLI